jgi:hypothetical protein
VASSHTGYEQMAGFCEISNEPSDPRLAEQLLASVRIEVYIIMPCVRLISMIKGKANPLQAWTGP